MNRPATRSRLASDRFPTYAFVDFNNVDPEARDLEAPVVDALMLVGQVLSDAFGADPGQPPRDVVCRLYDGWLDRSGQRLAKYRIVQRNLHVLDGLRGGTRIRSEIATSLALNPSLVLVGTYKNGAQKMVDQMIAQDVHHFAREAECEALVVMSGDDDFVPVMIGVGSTYPVPVILLRQRVEGLNDQHCRAAGVTLLNHPDWAAKETVT